MVFERKEGDADGFEVGLGTNAFAGLFADGFADSLTVGRLVSLELGVAVTGRAEGEV